MKAPAPEAARLQSGPALGQNGSGGRGGLRRGGQRHSKRGEAMESILAGDIGGTNTRLALFDPGNLREPQAVRVYRSGDFESFLSILNRYYQEAGEAIARARPVRAGFGVAGPVDGTIVKLTNLPWVIDAEQVRERVGLEHVIFVNDFAANCQAVPHLAPADVHRIGGGTPLPDQPIAVLGAGTGLGEGFLVHTGTEYLVVPSEGGHKDFAARNPLEIRLLAFLTEQFKRVSVERVLSGQGLIHLYEFFRDVEKMGEAPAVRERMREEDPAAVISRHALARSDPVCERALELFCGIYGAEAGNLALTVLARGGVYLAGGIAGKIIPFLEGGGFRYGFEQKGRYTHLLESTPTYVIVHPQPGLMGAAIAASHL
jgi:glucokinase